MYFVIFILIVTIIAVVTDYYAEKHIKEYASEEEENEARMQ